MGKERIGRQMWCEGCMQISADGWDVRAMTTSRALAARTPNAAEASYVDTVKEPQSTTGLELKRASERQP